MARGQVGREAEAKDAYRMALMSPLWSLGSDPFSAAAQAGVEDVEAFTQKVVAMSEKAREVELQQVSPCAGSLSLWNCGSTVVGSRGWERWWLWRRRMVGGDGGLWVLEQGTRSVEEVAIERGDHLIDAVCLGAHTVPHSAPLSCFAVAWSRVSTVGGRVGCVVVGSGLGKVCGVCLAGTVWAVRDRVCCGRDCHRD